MQSLTFGSLALCGKLETRAVKNLTKLNQQQEKGLKKKT